MIGARAMLGSTSALAAMVLQSASFPHQSTPYTHRMTARLLLIDDDVRLSAMVEIGRAHV